MIFMLCGFRKARVTWQTEQFGEKSLEESAQIVDSMDGKNAYLQEMLDNGVVAKQDGAYYIEPKNVYEDFACPTQQYLLRFLGQLMLMWMVVYNIAYEPSSEPPLDDEPFELIAGVRRADFFFWSAVIVQLMAVTQVSTSFDERCFWWLYMLSTKLSSIVLDRDPDTDTQAIGIRLWSTGFTAYPRFFFSFVINGCCMDFIFLIIPFLLMEAASPLDYVKDTFAVAYIVTLDNIDDERKYYFRKPAQLACWWGGHQQEAQQTAEGSATQEVQQSAIIAEA